MALEETAVRLWKRLTREEKLAAAACFWREPAEALLGSALGVVVKARHVRPQVARSLPIEVRAQALASVQDPSEPMAAALLVSLHLGERRALLAAFLDALGLPHENGILKEDAPEPPLAEAAAKAAFQAVTAGFPRHQVETYLNTLWLQDPERWDVLRKSAEWA
jgi:hypothetical protein